MQKDIKAVVIFVNSIVISRIGYIIAKFLSAPQLTCVLPSGIARDKNMKG